SQYTRDRNTLATGQSSGHRKVQGKAHIIRVWLADTHRLFTSSARQDFQRAVCCVAFSSYDKGELPVRCRRSQRPPPVSVGLESRETTLPGEGIQGADHGRRIQSAGAKRHRELRPRPDLLLDHRRCQEISKLKGARLRPQQDHSRELSGRTLPTRSLLPDVPSRMAGWLAAAGAGRLVLWDDSCQREADATRRANGVRAVRCIVQGKGERLYPGDHQELRAGGARFLLMAFSPSLWAIAIELWGLAVDVPLVRFLTCGDDELVYIERLPETHINSVEKPRLVKQGAHCCARHVARWHIWPSWAARRATNIVLDAANRLAPYFNQEDSFESRLKILNLVAANNRQLDLVAKCQGHTSFVTHIDWSADGTLLRSKLRRLTSCSTGRCPTVNSEFDDSVTPRCQVADWNLLPELRGLLEFGGDANDGTDVNAVCVDARRHSVRRWRRLRLVNLYSYPVSGRQGGGHSSHVTNVAFTPDGKRLISCGGREHGSDAVAAGLS
uniref:WD_REPEATS_REGION domain-containing protein n=1 Tax=Macrostomum lignano TaxID=282301 RepID=A0A1I8FAV1_9PLAT